MVGLDEVSSVAPAVGLLLWWLLFGSVGVDPSVVLSPLEGARGAVKSPWLSLSLPLGKRVWLLITRLAMI